MTRNIAKTRNPSSGVPSYHRWIICLSSVDAKFSSTGFCWSIHHHEYEYDILSSCFDCNTAESY